MAIELYRKAALQHHTASVANVIEFYQERNNHVMAACFMYTHYRSHALQVFRANVWRWPNPSTDELAIVYAVCYPNIRPLKWSEEVKRTNPDIAYYFLELFPADEVAFFLSYHVAPIEVRGVVEQCLPQPIAEEIIPHIMVFDTVYFKQAETRQIAVRQPAVVQPPAVIQQITAREPTLMQRAIILLLFPCFVIWNLMALSSLRESAVFFASFSFQANFLGWLYLVTRSPSLGLSATRYLVFLILVWFFVLDNQTRSAYESVHHGLVHYALPTYPIATWIRIAPRPTVKAWLLGYVYPALYLALLPLTDRITGYQLYPALEHFNGLLAFFVCSDAIVWFFVATFDKQESVRPDQREE